MKRNRCFLCIVFLALFLQITQASALSTETSYFQTTVIEESKQNQIVSNLNIALVEKENNDAPIECFDINQEGDVVIGLGTSPHKTLYVYDDSGTFQYGFTFQCNGKYGVGWSDDVVEIYLVRSSIAVQLDQTGKCISILHIEDSIHNNNYWNDVVFAQERVFNDKAYLLQNDASFTVGFSRLVVADSNGSEQTVYSCNSQPIFPLVLFLFLCVVPLVILFSFKKAN